MNLQFYIERLENSKEFKDFKKKNSKAYIYSAFFVRDKEGNNDDMHIDFCSGEKIISFHIGKEIKMVPVDKKEELFLEKIENNIDVDFDEIEKMINGKMFDDKITNKIQKILLSLQKVKGVNYLIGTIFISGLGLIKLKINLDKKEILEFEKKSLLDMMKIIKKGD